MSKKAPTIKMFLGGGLGNQLFQYAFARALAMRNEANLVLDAASIFEIDYRYKRSFELDAFKLPPEVKILRRKPFAVHLRRKFVELTCCRGPHLSNPYVRELRPLKFYPEYLDWKVYKNVNLLGYWQCEQYFVDFKSQILQDLSFLNPINECRAEFLKKIQASNSVAVHVRRADYSQAIGLGYYEASINQMRQIIGNPRFFVFTDVPDWWEKNAIEGDDIELVPSGDLPAIEDFKLMTYCQHYIIANSTFSWWAAWLGKAKHEASQIISPQREIWDNKSIVPENWSTNPANY